MDDCIPTFTGMTQNAFAGLVCTTFARMTGTAFTSPTSIHAHPNIADKAIFSNDLAHKHLDQ